MAGLSLNVGGYGSASSGTGGMPVAANQPTGLTVSQQAYGISSGSAARPSAVAYGSVGLGAVAAGFLFWLWYTLPR